MIGRTPWHRANIAGSLIATTSSWRLGSPSGCRRRRSNLSCRSSIPTIISGCTPTRGLYFLLELMADLGGGHNIVLDRIPRMPVDVPRRRTGRDEAGRRGRVRRRHRPRKAPSGQYGKTRALRGHHRLGRPDVGRDRCATCWRSRIAPPVAAVSAACATAPPMTRDPPASSCRGHHAGAPGCWDPRLARGLVRCWARWGRRSISWHFHPQLPDLVDLARAFPEYDDHLRPCGRHAGRRPVCRRRTAEVIAGLEEEHRRAGQVPERRT